jgi:hypothetical protein
MIEEFWTLLNRKNTVSHGIRMKIKQLHLVVEFHNICIWIQYVIYYLHL